MTAVYKKMHDALVRTGRPMVFSLCQYGYERVWRWGASVGGNLWRTTEDITDHYDRMSVIGFDQDGLEPFAGAGHWNDPDMLEVGNGGMNHDEYITHMSLWVLLAAPLLAGNDLSKMNQETLDILTNKEVIAVDQDAKGSRGAASPKRVRWKCGRSLLPMAVSPLVSLIAASPQIQLRSTLKMSVRGPVSICEIFGSTRTWDRPLEATLVMSRGMG